MASDRKADTGRRIFRYLMQRRNQPFRFGEVCHDPGLPTSKSTRAAIGQVTSELARQMGLYLTVPCPSNDWTLAITDDVTQWPKPDRQLLAVTQGIQRRRDQGMAFASASSSQLDASQAALLEAVADLDEQTASLTRTRERMMARLAETLG